MNEPKLVLRCRLNADGSNPEITISNFRELLKGIVCIYYISWANGNGIRHKHGVYWVAEKDYKTIDYNYRNRLIEEAIKSKEKYAVLRIHKGGAVSITEKNY